MKVLAVSDNTQLAKLEDIAFFLGVWLQVSDSSGIKALQDMSKAFFSWNELKAVFFGKGNPTLSPVPPNHLSKHQILKKSCSGACILCLIEIDLGILEKKSSCLKILKSDD